LAGTIATSRIECLDSKSVIKKCWDFVSAIFNTSVWLQAGQYLALAAQIPAKQKTKKRKAAVVPYVYRPRARTLFLRGSCEGGGDLLLMANAF
jgi:hypothetical protein